MIDLLLIALPLLTATGCFLIVFDKDCAVFVRAYFFLMGALFLWLFVGEAFMQFAGYPLLASRIVRAMMVRLTAFVATWVFVFAFRLRSGKR